MGLKQRLQLTTATTSIASFFSSTSKSTLDSTFTPSGSVVSLLKRCKSLAEAKLIHQQIVVRGLSLSLKADTTTPLSQLVHVYITCDAPSDALTTLKHGLLPSPYTVFYWNTLIKNNVLHRDLFNDALKLYVQMQRLGWRPDGYTFPYVLKGCGELPSFKKGASIHAAVRINGFDGNVFVCNAIVAMYGKCDALDDARLMFDEMSQRGVGDVVSWNSIIAAYVQTGDPATALKVCTMYNIQTSLLSEYIIWGVLW
ncbi:unnamed protein product [Ilex paraguariensis]|uniref:Pentatricopeptide repeat-containing protein n=1 Tax=Ilex paraguariensis TaxID=185542 RepID=A0ABC8TNK7_9AQUA